jgi:hypothetical protein
MGRLAIVGCFDGYVDECMGPERKTPWLMQSAKTPPVRTAGKRELSKNPERR